ncbi:hypothetical protein RHGRI_022931 [Rhododendron griersonianum]|uniref:Ferredoxin-thioredoxin reductase catalytic chain, chloroplastic n=1 Tax=Rhododendron griersonianum TaxID=479676 RepID=A0AAV6J664_9ERIC|nr:hypothetical protein RHGRI_022931 [Rhododendron griersonianum]
MLVSREGTFVSTKESLLLLSRDLLTIKDSVGAPLCSCRHYDDKAAEAGQGFWNRPRVPMRERGSEYSHHGFFLLSVFGALAANYCIPP